MKIHFGLIWNVKFHLLSIIFHSKTLERWMKHNTGKNRLNLISVIIYLDSRTNTHRTFDQHMIRHKNGEIIKKK